VNYCDTEENLKEEDTLVLDGVFLQFQGESGGRTSDTMTSSGRTNVDELTHDSLQDQFESLPSSSSTESLC